ncbi:uncharacterized protein LOC141665289 [Apium graveolens]|uniref:uncharacterized protein LOC141665289 n=1 Tax=Apium graveolens TaxID=4045 RepID=UPI003D79908B
MDSSLRIQSDWFQARKKQEDNAPGRADGRETMPRVSAKWKLPVTGTFKLNVDASVYPGTNAFAVGMVLRNDTGNFMEARTYKYSGEVSVVEAETIGVREALSWIKELRMQDEEITVESDSHITVNAIQKICTNYLEVGEIVEECKQILSSLNRVSVVFIRKNANRVAHEVARIPCLVNSYNVFTSPPTCLLEALAYDVLI